MYRSPEVFGFVNASGNKLRGRRRSGQVVGPNKLSKRNDSPKTILRQHNGIIFEFIMLPAQSKSNDSSLAWIKTNASAFDTRKLNDNS